MEGREEKGTFRYPRVVCPALDGLIAQEVL